MADAGTTAALRVTVLGCAGSLGTPLVGNRWGACDPTEPRNRRRRPSILVETPEESVLVDTGPDCRAQLLDARAERLTRILYTHEHADHVHGLDDIRPLVFGRDTPIPAYADDPTATAIVDRFAYAVADVEMDRGLYRPLIAMHRIAPGDTLRFADMTVAVFRQGHGRTDSLGFRFGDRFAYSTDAVDLDEAAFEALAGVDTWIVDATRIRPHASHAHLELTLEWIDRLRPRQAYLTHMNHEMDYATLCAQLPAHIRPAHDGLVLTFPAG